jgi:hypothetical protein
MALALVLTSGSVRAELVLVFDDPDTPEIDYRIEDQGGLDGADSPGVIHWVIDERPTGLYAIATAISKPVIPFAGDGDLGILGNELSLSLLAFRYPGSLNIGLTDTDYDFPDPTTGVAGISGAFVGGATIDFVFYGDTANEEFGQGFEIVSFGPVDSPEADLDIPDLEGTAEPVGSLSINAITVQGEGEDFDVLGSLDLGLELVDAEEEDDDCPSNKILICHFPPGNPLNAKEICVGAAAVEAHLRHGDNVGECPEVFEDPTGRGRSKPPPGRSKR